MGKSMYILVKFDNDFKKKKLFKLLIEEGFQRDTGSGFCPWVFVDINTKLFRSGKPGICFGPVIGDHAVTVKEFITIYNIYKKYAGLDPLEMKKEN